MYSIVPIQNIPNNRFSSKIPVDGQNLTLIFYVTYNELAKYWLIDISNADGTMLLSGLPVVPAQNILEQYQYMQIGSAYILPRSKVKEQWPSADTLSTDWYLIWSDTDGYDGE